MPWCAADLDHDGDIDLVTGDSANRLIAWRNDMGTVPRASWVSRTWATPAATVRAVAVGDLDGDGLCDVASATTAASSRSGITWQPLRRRLAAAGAAQDVVPAVRSLALADLDGDGDLDIVAATDSAGAGNELFDLQNPSGASNPFVGAWTRGDLGGIELECGWWSHPTWTRTATSTWRAARQWSPAPR